MEKIKILVVDDEERMQKLLKDFLKMKDYEVLLAGNGEEAIDLFFKEKSIALIILDVMMPKMDGWTALKTIREHSKVPVIMLTAKSEDVDKVLGLGIGADDYVTKPFSPLILVKRIENILRRNTVASEIAVGDLTVSIDDCTVYWQGEKMPLTKKEYEILQTLAKRKGHLVTRDQLMNTIWGYSELDSRVLDNHIKNIRKKIPGVPLKTITGMGYQLGGEDK